MAKLALTVLILRLLQLALALVFIIFWAWSCAVKTPIGGGGGEYFLGFFTALVSLAISAHGILAFVRKQHLEEHRMLYHNARWAIDMLVVVLWLAVIIIGIVVPTNTSTSQYGGPASATELGSNFGSLFSVITFFMTALLLIFATAIARRAGKTPRDQEKAAAAAADTGVQQRAPAS